MEIDVAEASRRLGVNDSRVRQLLRDGSLRGRRIGNSWAIDAEEVARRQRSGRRPGRPLAPKRAWALLDVLDGGDAPWLSDSARSQVRRYLADLVAPAPADWIAALRSRSRVVGVVAHPAALARLRDLDGVLPAGVELAVERGVDLVAIGDSVPEVYLADDAWIDASRSLALREASEVDLRVRIPLEVWPFGARDEPGDAVLAADLLESAEPRGVVAGADRLGELLAQWQSGRSRA